MSTISTLAEHRVLLDGVSWQTYSAIDKLRLFASMGIPEV